MASIPRRVPLTEAETLRLAQSQQAVPSRHPLSQAEQLAALRQAHTQRKVPAKPPAPDPRNFLWRQRLRMARYKGAPFHVDQQGRSSGRRLVVHEYPKRDVPFAEDMGRHALRYQMTGYLIQAPAQALGPPSTDGPVMVSNYDEARDLLEEMLLSGGPGPLDDPYNPRLQLSGYNGTRPLFACERYTIVETRDKGGFCVVEMLFVESGIAGNTTPAQDTVGAVDDAADKATEAAADSLNLEQIDVNGEQPDEPALTPELPAPSSELPLPTVTVTETPVELPDTANEVLFNVPTAGIATLPSAVTWDIQFPDRDLVLKDISGLAGANGIVIAAALGDLIDGLASITLAGNYAVNRLRPRPGSHTWMRV
jgi:hypothetical protein